MPQEPETEELMPDAASIWKNWAQKRPPPPPVGQVVFKRNADGSLGYDLVNTANGGAAVLGNYMPALLTKLNAQMDYVNGKALTAAQISSLALTAAQQAAMPQRVVPAADQALNLVAARMPGAHKKVTTCRAKRPSPCNSALKKRASCGHPHWRNALKSF